MSTCTNDSPAFLTNMAGNYLHEQLTKKLAESEFPVSKQQLRILFYLYEEDGIEQKRIKDYIKLSKISLVNIINGLEELNLVVRVPSETDMRNNRLFLTSLGKKLKLPLQAIVDEHRAVIFKGFSSEEMELYVSMLKRIIHNVTSSDS